MRRLLVVFALLVAVSSLASGSDGYDNEWLSVAVREIQHSQLTLPGSAPFHLKAAIVETTNPRSEYHAQIEEYWVSPEKWRRTIESPSFSQTMVVNGDKVLEKDTGDYFPWWLNDFVTAIFDPLGPVVGPAVAQSGKHTAVPREPNVPGVCTTIDAPTDRISLCFDFRRDVLVSVFSLKSGYGADFSDFRGFAKKQVPRRIASEPESGTKIEAVISQLDELREPDEQMFAIEQSTPPQDRIARALIDQKTFRELSLTDTTIDWPLVGGPPLKGNCTVYVSADRSGRVREVWPGGCDNTGLEEPLRSAVRKWRLKTALLNNLPVQVDSRVTFPFQVQVDPNVHPLPMLSDAEVRSLATHMVEPVFPPGNGYSGTQIIAHISVDETGKLTGFGTTPSLQGPVFVAIYSAVMQWRFTPYIKNGKPQYFHADITFRIP
jgi:hypothetical protein